MTYTKCTKCIPYENQINQHFSLYGPPKFTQIGNFGLKKIRSGNPEAMSRGKIIVHRKWLRGHKMLPFAFLWLRQTFESPCSSVWEEKEAFWDTPNEGREGEKKGFTATSRKCFRMLKNKTEKQDLKKTFAETKKNFENLDFLNCRVCLFTFLRSCFLFLYSILQFELLCAVFTLYKNNHFMFCIRQHSNPQPPNQNFNFFYH
jgi:hypothetical protein